MNKNDYLILAKIKDQGCVNEIKSLTVDAIKGLTNLSVSKVRRSIVELKKASYIKEGILQRNAKTYYITKTAINKMNKLMEVSK